jgi:hypothetical protein
MKVLEKLPKMTDEDIFKLFQNAIRLSLKGPNKDADRVIQAIEQEWQRRRELARKGEYQTTRPVSGMLAALGYHVGHRNGSPAPLRHKVLERLFYGQLPLVLSPTYTDEWGEPASEKRFSKLVRTISAFLDDPGKNAQPNMEKAVAEWAEDLAWIRKSLGGSSS